MGSLRNDPPPKPLRRSALAALHPRPTEESPSKQMGARAHTAGHNMHNTGYNGFCYSSSECGQPPERPARGTAGLGARRAFLAVAR